MKTCFLAATLLIAMGGLVQAQNQASIPSNNGRYFGSLGKWQIDLTVKDGRGDLTMSCGSNVMFGKATVSPEGTVFGSLKSGAQLRGNLITGIEIVAGGGCGNGVTTMSKKS